MRFSDIKFPLFGLIANYIISPIKLKTNQIRLEVITRTKIELKENNSNKIHQCNIYISIQLIKLLYFKKLQKDELKTFG